MIGPELSSPNLNSSVRVEQSFAICYLNVVIKPLCGNPDIRLNYYFRSWNSVRCETCFFESRFSVVLLRNLADFASEIHFGRENPQHANAPNDWLVTSLFCIYASSWRQGEPRMTLGLNPNIWKARAILHEFIGLLQACFEAGGARGLCEDLTRTAKPWNYPGLNPASTDIYPSALATELSRQLQNNNLTSDTILNG